jgi:hypothetical protein
MVSSQGVRQLCPEGVFTSAPAGSDSNRTAAVGGDEFRKFRLGTDAEQAATVNPHAMTAMTRLIITPNVGGFLFFRCVSPTKLSKARGFDAPGSEYQVWAWIVFIVVLSIPFWFVIGAIVIGPRPLRR